MLIRLLLGTCLACRRGHFQVCAHGSINGVTKDGGCEWLVFVLVYTDS